MRAAGSASHKVARPPAILPSTSMERPSLVKSVPMKVTPCWRKSPTIWRKVRRSASDPPSRSSKSPIASSNRSAGVTPLDERCVKDIKDASAAGPPSILGAPHAASSASSSSSQMRTRPRYVERTVSAFSSFASISATRWVQRCAMDLPPAATRYAQAIDAADNAAAPKTPTSRGFR